ncbi:MAG: hypothetical protein ACYC75_02940 [Minisyncoccota bacterium]
MATIINNPSPERVIEKKSTDYSGWVVAVIILLVIIALGAYLWFQYYPTSTTTNYGGTNINLTVPAATTGTSTGATAGTSSTTR